MSEELRETLSRLTGYPSDSRTVQAFEHVCREFAAAELRAAANAASDEYSGWEAANVVRACADTLIARNGGTP